jgi:hypothetical protein
MEPTCGTQRCTLLQAKSAAFPTIMTGDFLFAGHQTQAGKLKPGERIVGGDEGAEADGLSCRSTGRRPLALAGKSFIGS